MYDVCITFDDRTEPLVWFKMSRQDYNDEMRGWQVKYDLEIEKVDEFTTGDKLIFVNAHERTMKRLLQNIEREKSRARYYTRRDGIAGKEGRD